MSINPNDINAIITYNQDAVKNSRNRVNQRTPDSSNNHSGTYPLRNVQEYPGGHRTIIDNTPGNRVVEHQHGSGTYQQWADDGTETRVVVGNGHHHYKEGLTITIEQNGDVKINGHGRISVSGGVHIEVQGDASMVFGGDLIQYVGGDHKVVVAGDYLVSCGGQMSHTASGNQTLRSGGNIDVTADGNMTQNATRIDLNP